MGVTGCGKSTKVPQFIVDRFSREDYSNEKFKVICTTPTRICAVSLANYVADCRGGFVGDEVGFSIGGERIKSKVTKIEYQTAGVLRETLLSGQPIPASHICIDEVHTRTVDVDTILYLIKRVLKKNEHLRVILMSASISPEDYVNYFKDENESGIVPVVEVPSRLYKTEVRYLENAMSEVILNGTDDDAIRYYETMKFFLEENNIQLQLEEMGPDGPPHRRTQKYNSNNREFIKENEANSREGAVRYLSKQLQVLSENNPGRTLVRGRLHNEIIETCAYRIIQLHRTEPKNRTFLVFLPGIREIISFERYILYHLEDEWESVKIFILHSQIKMSQQQDAIKFQDRGKRKIILSTNIAESSVTIPDVHFIFDFCLQKEIQYNFEHGTKQLLLKWTCKDNLLQRTGRAGRVQNGVIYRLLFENDYDNLRQTITPEIQRESLVDVMLKLIKLNLGFVENILKDFITPPQPEHVRRGFMDLYELGCLRQIERTTRPVVTAFGDFICNFPLNLNSCCLVYYGLLFGNVHECVILAALVDIQGVIYKSFTNPLQSYRTLYRLSKGSESDVIANYLVYLKWLKQKRLNERSRKYVTMEKFCKSNGLRFRAVQELEFRVVMIYEKLMESDFKIERPKFEEELYSRGEDDLEFFRILIGAAFRSKVVKTVRINSKKLPNETMNPNRTVLLWPLKDRPFSRMDNESVMYMEDFLRNYDGGFGKVSKKYIHKQSGDMYLEFDESEFKDFDDIDPIKLITRVDDRDFQNYRLDDAGKWGFCPYRKAFGTTRVSFQSLFFPHGIRKDSFSTIEEYIPRGPRFQRNNHFVFGNEMLGGKGDVLMVNTMSLIPTTRWPGLLDVFFLVFSSRVGFAELLSENGFFYVVQNDSIYLFKPGILTKEIVFLINDLRSFVPQFIQNIKLWDGKVEEYQKRYKQKLYKLLDLYSVQKVNSGGEVDNSLEYRRILRRLEFVKEKRKKNRVFLRKICSNIFGFVGEELEKDCKWSALLFLRQTVLHKQSEFVYKLTKMDYGDSFIFTKDCEGGIKVSKVKGRDMRKLGKVHQHNKMDLEYLNWALGKAKRFVINNFVKKGKINCEFLEIQNHVVLKVRENKISSF